MWKYFYIYKITNLMNNKIYVGQRKTNIIPEEDNYFGSGKIIILAIKKHGIINFSKNIIEFCENWDELNKKEKYWIKELNSLHPNGYNLCEGGRGGISRGVNHPFFNKEHSEITKYKISEKLKGVNRLFESIEKQKITNSNRLCKHSEETKNKISASKKNKKQTKEHLEALSKVRKGKPSQMKGKIHTVEAIEKNRLAHLGKTPTNAKKVDVFTDDNIFIKTFNSLRELNRKMNTVSRNVVCCCNGKRKTYHNLIFKWHLTN